MTSSWCFLVSVYQLHHMADAISQIQLIKRLHLFLWVVDNEMIMRHFDGKHIPISFILSCLRRDGLFLTKDLLVQTYQICALPPTLLRNRKRDIPSRVRVSMLYLFTCWTNNWDPSQNHYWSTIQIRSKNYFRSLKPYRYQIINMSQKQSNCGMCKIS